MHSASMKALPKRKGNAGLVEPSQAYRGGLNESPSEKEGKWMCRRRGGCRLERLNESPSEKEGKFHGSTSTMSIVKRLNESPSEKEGKWRGLPREAEARHGSLNESPYEKAGKSMMTVHKLSAGDGPQ